MAAAQRGRWAAAATMLALAVLLTPSTTTRVVQAQSSLAPAPGPGSGSSTDDACFTALLNMSDCLPYVQNGSTARRPDKPCCPELAGLVESNPVCLCALLAGAGDSYGLSVDYSRALKLPAICRVATPPVSTCAAFGYNVPMGPSPAPAVSPSGEGPQFPGSSPSSSPRPASPSHGTRRFAAAGGLVTLAAVVVGML